MPIIQAIGVVFIIYIIFLIIKSIIAIRHSLRERQMVKDISEINQKLSSLLERFPNKEKKVKKIK